jgi:glycosyltransferase involved in cell wall biosynthesis
VRDTSGNVVLEAMGLHCPVICFKHQGVEFITDDHGAFRIEPASWDHSVTGFASAILALSKDHPLVESMGKAGRERAMQEFTWDLKIGQMLKIYQRVIPNAAKD